MEPSSLLAKPTSRNQRTVRVLESASDLAEIREVWARLQRHPNANWDFYWHINATRQQPPCVLELRQDGEVKSLWIGRIEKGRVPLEFGYRKLGSIPVYRLSIITGGVLGDTSEEACRLLIERARQLLAERQLDVLVLNYIPVDHPLFGLAAELPSWSCRDWGTRTTIHWTMTLPASFEQFLRKRSNKHRYWLNRLPRALEAAYPGQVRIRSFTTPNEIGEFWHDAGEVAESTYQYQLGESFCANADYLARCKSLAEKGMIRGYVLYIADQPRAYWMATVCHVTAYLNFTGYYPEFKKFELGTILLMKLFEDLCGTSVEKVDFGHGGATYKERFGDGKFYEASIRIYRLAPRALVLNFLTAVNARLSVGIGILLSRTGMMQKVKTLWRRRLAGKELAL